EGADVGTPLPSSQASLRPAAPRRAVPLRPSCPITGVAPARDSGGQRPAWQHQAGRPAQQAGRAPQEGAKKRRKRALGRPPCWQVRAGQATCVPALGISPALSVADSPATWLASPRNRAQI